MLELDDDIAFDKLYADKREKEMVSLLRQVVNELKKDNGDSEISEAIYKNSEVIKSFFVKLNEISKPEINIENKNEEIVSLGIRIMENQKSISEKQDKLIAILEMKPKTLKVNRDSRYGDPLITSIDIEYSLVIYKK